jgi:hypothetical protein
MKKTLLIAAIVLSAATYTTAAIAAADQKSDALLGALKQKVASWGDYRVDFTVTIDGQSVVGSYEVSGARYHVFTPDIELYCDGTTKWEASTLDREVAIDRVDPNDRTVMGNPTRLFDFLDGSYTRRYIGPALINGQNCDRIEMTETAATTSGGAAQTIDLYLSTATGLPVRVGYTIGMMSTEAAIDVVKITPRVTLGPSFSYDLKRYSGWEIIDFR